MQSRADVFDPFSEGRVTRGILRLKAQRMGDLTRGTTARRVRGRLWVLCLGLCLGLVFGWPRPVWAQRSAEELRTLCAPVALYPDALLTNVLVAASYPAEVAEAASWVDSKGPLDVRQVDTAMRTREWDPAVKSLTAFPTVLSYLNQNMAWTVDLGNAYVLQPQAVLDTIQTLRLAAVTAGTLRTNSEILVRYLNGAVVIESVNPNLVYVPSYDPYAVYYAAPYGYAPISWGAGIYVGMFLWMGVCDWRYHHLYLGRGYNFYYGGTRYGGAYARQASTIRTLVGQGRGLFHWSPQHRHEVPLAPATQGPARGYPGSSRVPGLVRPPSRPSQERVYPRAGRAVSAPASLPIPSTRVSTPQPTTTSEERGYPRTSTPSSSVPGGSPSGRGTSPTPPTLAPPRGSPRTLAPHVYTISPGGTVRIDSQRGAESRHLSVPTPVRVVAPPAPPHVSLPPSAPHGVLPPSAPGGVPPSAPRGGQPTFQPSTTPSYGRPGGWGGSHGGGHGYPQPSQPPAGPSQRGPSGGTAPAPPTPSRPFGEWRNTGGGVFQGGQRGNHGGGHRRR